MFGCKNCHKFTTKLVWDNAALVSPETAKALNITQGEMAVVRVGEGQIQVPVFIVPGQANGSIAIAIGYGRKCDGLGDGTSAVVGKSVAPLRTTGAMYVLKNASVTPTSVPYKLASTQDHFAIDQLGADETSKRSHMLIREGTLEQIIEGGHEFIEHKGLHHPPLESLWQERSTRSRATRRALSVGHDDRLEQVYWLQLLRGCLPVGKQYSSRWQRTGLAQSRDALDSLGSLLLWQSCSAKIVYQQWLAYTVKRLLANKSARWLLRCTPKKVSMPWRTTAALVRAIAAITVRTKFAASITSTTTPSTDTSTAGKIGAKRLIASCSNWSSTPMSAFASWGDGKCTYCIQRVQAGKIQARTEGRRVEDGEIQSACQVACPTQAIVFGDLKDPATRVSRLQKDPRNYAMLEELNTKPRTVYLARVRNVHQRLKTADQKAEGTSLPLTRKRIWRGSWRA